MSIENWATISISIFATIVIPYLILAKDRKAISLSNEQHFQDLLIKEITSLRLENANERHEQNVLLQECYKANQQCHKDKLELIEIHSRTIKEYQQKQLELQQELIEIKNRVEGIFNHPE